DPAVGPEHHVLGLHSPMDDVPTTKIGPGLEQLEDVSSRAGRIGRLVPVALPECLTFELLLHETERPEVGALVQISDDPRMTGGAQGPQDLGLNPKPFVRLRKIGPAGLLDDDGLPAGRLAHVDGRHPAFRHLADDLIAAPPTFQGARKGEGHTVRGPISRRTGASPTRQRRSHRRPGVPVDPSSAPVGTSPRSGDSAGASPSVSVTPRPDSGSPDASGTPASSLGVESKASSSSFNERARPWSPEATCGCVFPTSRSSLAP